MFRALNVSPLLAAVYLASLCGCSALGFQTTEPEAVSALPPMESVGWQERLARLRERNGNPPPQAQERVASTTVRKRETLQSKLARMVFPPQEVQEPLSPPPQNHLSLGRWVRPATDRTATRTFDIERPDELETDALAESSPAEIAPTNRISDEPARPIAQSSRRAGAASPDRQASQAVEQPASYQVPVAVAADHAEERQNVERLAPVVAASAPSFYAPSVPVNRLRPAKVAVSPAPSAAPASEPIVSPRTPAKSIEPLPATSEESVPWQQATFRSLDE